MIQKIRSKKAKLSEEEIQRNGKIEESTSQIAQVGPQISVVMVDFQNEIFAIYKRSKISSKTKARKPKSEQNTHSV